ncbi:unnamed protein product [Colias eurytheme]|nr:unnamed protein product [Colias eurytheme]
MSGMPFQAMELQKGCDGTVTNTGKYGGVIRLLEKRLQRPLQWIICLLHLNELPLRHLFAKLDGTTTGPNTYSGAIGKLLDDCEKRPVIVFERIEGMLPDISNVKDLSSDQRYLYDITSAVISVTAYLQHEDLHICILKAPDASDSNAIKQDTKAKSKLILLIDPILYVHIQIAQNANQVWDNLTKAFEDRGLTRKAGLLIELINTNLESSLSKHIDVRHHYIRDKVRSGDIHIEYMMLADCLTKALAKPKHHQFLIGTGLHSREDVEI